MKTILRCSLCCLILASFCLVLKAQTPGIVEERGFFFASIEGRAYRLAYRVTRPDDNNRHPLVIMSHGGNVANPDLMNRYLPLTDALASEGLSVVYFVRRGFSPSEGPFNELQDTAINTGLETAKDYKAAVEYWREQSFVERDKVVLMGSSRSGWGVLAAATIPMDGVLGVVNIVGGTNFALQGNNALNSPFVLDHWEVAAAQLGRDAIVPSYWIYSESDFTIVAPGARRMFEAYNGAGGWGFLLMLPPYGPYQGHGIAHLPAAFQPQLNDFFATIGIRNEPTAAPSIVMSYGGGAFDPGDTSLMTVQLTANPLPTLQWRRNGVDLVNSANKIAGATSSALSIFDVQLADTGNYTVVATNALGSETSGPIPVSLVTPPAPTPTPTPTAPSRGSGGGGGGGAPSTWFISVLALVVIVRWIALRSRAAIDGIDCRIR